MLKLRIGANWEVMQISSLIPLLVASWNIAVTCAGGGGVIHHARATACARILQSVCDVTLHRMNDSMSTSGFESLNGLCRGSSNVANNIWPRLLVAVASSVLTDHRVVFTTRASGLASKQSLEGVRAADVYFRGKKGYEWLVRQPTVHGDEQASGRIICGKLKRASGWQQGPQ